MSIYVVNGLFDNQSVSEEDVVNIRHHAVEGDAEAQYHLALMYDTGNGVERNPKEAEKWYKLAVAQDHAGAQYYLAHMYSSNSSGIRRDDAQARKLLLAAAEQGHAEALKKIAN